LYAGKRGENPVSRERVHRSFDRARHTSGAMAAAASAEVLTGIISKSVKSFQWTA
jgi:hypothetical protein